MDIRTNVFLRGQGGEYLRISKAFVLCHGEPHRRRETVDSAKEQLARDALVMASRRYLCG